MIKIKFILLSSIIFLGACSVTEEQAKNDTNTETAIIPEVKDHSQIIDTPNNSTQYEPIIIEEHHVEDIIITEPWGKTQQSLNHQQRFAGALAAHNGVRIKHGLQPLKWSEKLVAYSQEWANALGTGQHCQIRHRSGNTLYGENLYRSSALIWDNGKTELIAINIKQVIKSWTDEERWFDYKRNRCQAGKQCGHYTQVVWRNTTEVGCAVKICADKSQTWVCSYNPKGNYIGVNPY